MLSWWSCMGREVLLEVERRSAPERREPMPGRGQTRPGELRAEGTSGEGVVVVMIVERSSGESISGVMPSRVDQSSWAEGSGDSISARR